MQASDIPYKFAQIWAAAAAAGYVTDPIPETITGAAASQELGFPPITAEPIGSGGVPPDIADFNGMFSYLSGWANWFQAGAPVRYDATFQSDIGGYPEGAIVESASTPGRFWISTTDNNAGNPDTGSTNWRPWPWFHTAATGTASLSRITSFTNYQVSVGATVTLPPASTAEGALFAFYAAGACTIGSGGAGGTFSGGPMTGATSVALATNDWLMVVSSGANWRVLSSSISQGRLLGVQVWAGNATYTPASGMRVVIFEVQGSGASGGGTQATGAGEAAAGGGGGAGGYAKGVFTAGAVGASQAVTVGAAVAGLTGSAGQNGNTSSVGALISAPGGMAGDVGLATTSFVQGTVGGGPSAAPSGGNIETNVGGAGGFGITYADDNCNGGYGGISHYGAGGVTQTNGNGADGINYGSGGAGGQAIQSSGDTAGGASAPGRVTAWEYS